MLRWIQTAWNEVSYGKDETYRPIKLSLKPDLKLWVSKIPFGLGKIKPSHLFVRPVLLGMQGAEVPKEGWLEAVLDCDFAKGSPHERYERGRWFMQNGRILCRPLPSNKSSMMVSIQNANGLIIVPPGKRKKGDRKGEHGQGDSA